MILVDTSVWIDHLRSGVARLETLLRHQLVATHAFVIGELACGRLRDRSELLAHLARLPQATRASDAEALTLVEERRLWGAGLGWVDVHLLASALLDSAAIWTRDRQLATAAVRLGVATD